MADTTRLTIDIESILRGLDKTLRGLASIRKSLESVANVKVSQQGAATANRASIAAQRLAQQQQKLNVQTQELANRQERVRQTTERLAQSQQRLESAAAKVSTTLGKQADAHVRAFRAIEAASTKTSQTILGVGNSLRSIGQGLSTVGATLSVALTAPLIALSAASVDAAVQLDSLKRGLTAIVGSSEEANRQLARLTQIAKLPGIGFEEAIQGSIRLQAVGFSAKQAETALREFSNAVALTGGGRDELARVTVQLGQLAAKGKVLSQDLRPIIEAAPAVGRALLQAFGTVNAADIQELGLSSRQFLDTLVAQLGELPRAAAGAKNSFENFRDEIFRASAAVGGALLPALTRLAEVVGPVIVKLANVFAALPAPIQIIVLGFGALVAALGPILFVVGQLTTGVGRLIVGFGQLNTLGIIPTIRNLRTLAAGALAAAEAEQTLAATGALVAASVGAIFAVLGTVALAYAIYNALQKDSITLNREQVDALTDQINGLKQQAKFIDDLKDGVERTADEQDRLLDIYGQLNTAAKVRVTGISDEKQQLATLREELGKVIALREQERVQQAASLAGELANSLVRVQANANERDAIAGRIQSNTALIETLEHEQAISIASTRELAKRGITASNVEAAIGALKTESEGLSDSQDDLITSGKELNDKAKEQAAILRSLERQTGLTARQLLVAAQSMGVFRGNIEEVLTTLERYVDETGNAARATDEFTRALDQQEKNQRDAGERADAEAKRRRGQISAAAAQAREAADSFEGALKFMRAFIAEQPRLHADVERERQIQGKSLAEFLEDALEGAFKGRAKSKSGTGLRNAQEQLARSLAEVAQASADEQGAIERLKNERSLRENENAFKLQLVAYREYLNRRAALTSANLQLEINAQRSIVATANEEQKRLADRAARGGLPAAERTKAQAGAAAAQERAIKAQTKILELEQQQRDARVEVDQLLRESAKQQLEDTRKLEQEFAELRGAIESALNAATDNKFHDELLQLAQDQDDLNKRLELARHERNADEIAELELARAQKQRRIDTILGIKEQEDALATLAAANELVRRAKERQSQLEADLTNQVEFRGLKEEDATQQRLAGERKLNDSLTIAHETIRQVVAALQARGVEPPRALVEFLDQLRTEVKGLGELPFSEQFRLAQKEFERINDERVAKIADVERAVRNRDIAEVEGAILIRRINGQYTADLEAQLGLLKQIADASNDRGLQRQAADAGETVKDTRDELASLGKQINAAGKDAFRSGLTDFFNDILNRTATAKEALLSLLDSVTTAISNVIAENLSKELFESLFGGADQQAGGLIATVKRLFGFGGGGGGNAITAEVAGTGEAAAHTAESTAAARALTTGATAAATALTTGGTTAAASIVTGLTAAAASFAAAVIAAGAAFAASVGIGAGAQSIGGLGGALGGAATGLFPAVPGGAIRVLEGGHPEAILTTDPKYALRQVGILREFLSRTRGLGGRIRGFEMGGIVSRETAEANLLSSINRAPSMRLTSADAAPIASTSRGDFIFRQILVDDQRDISNWYNSAEGDRVQVQWLARNRPQVQKLLGIGDR